ncbi:YxlC family protein [Paenibacillus sp.]|uniref:YxlC family protein n=1 Tax=Paenibacillus sp. TaxID=58172 RepID=UPI0028AF2FF6|nr:YxlC family protein [Paenibacillus sp.]
MERDKDKESVLYLHKLSDELDRLDAQYNDITPPSLQELERLMADASVHRKSTERKELLLFWGISLILICAFLSILGSAPMIYWIIQAIIPIAGLSALGIARIRRNREGAQE